jgi:hypothetical protein
MTQLQENHFFDDNGKPFLVAIANYLNTFIEKYYDISRGTIWVKYSTCPDGIHFVDVTFFNGHRDNKSLYIYPNNSKDLNISIIDLIESYIVGEKDFNNI